MSDPPTSPSPPEKSLWGREGIAVAVSLIGAGASLNNWFPAFQAIGFVLVVVGILFLAAVAWQIAKPTLQRHLSLRSSRLTAGGLVIAVGGLALFGSQLPRPAPGLLTLSAPSEPSQASVSLLNLLPNDKDLAVDLVEHETGKRSGEALARLRSGNADELMQRLIEWGFVENAYRNFGRPPGATPTPDTVYLLEVSIFRWGNTTAASEALGWFAADRSELSGLAPVPIEPIGDEARAIAGEQENDNGATSYREATIYSRKGSVFVRVTARSQQANPMTLAVEISHLVVKKAST